MVLLLVGGVIGQAVVLGFGMLVHKSSVLLVILKRHAAAELTGRSEVGERSLIKKYRVKSTPSVDGGVSLL